MFLIDGQCYKKRKRPSILHTKGVGPSTTLTWPGWKQPVFLVKVDTARLETSRTDTVKGLAGYPVQKVHLGVSFLEGGPAGRGEWYMILCEWGCARRKPWNVAYTCKLSYPIIVSHLSFNFLCLVLL
jgi:hypothetical protein